MRIPNQVKLNYACIICWIWSEEASSVTSSEATETSAESARRALTTESWWFTGLSKLVESEEIVSVGVETLTSKIEWAGRIVSGSWWDSQRIVTFTPEWSISSSKQIAVRTNKLSIRIKHSPSWERIVVRG